MWHSDCGSGHEAPVKKHTPICWDMSIQSSLFSSTSRSQKVTPPGEAFDNSNPPPQAR